MEKFPQIPEMDWYYQHRSEKIFRTAISDEPSPKI
jgi:hypothetical protein